MHAGDREDHRPWGYFRVIGDEPGFKVKKIVIYPGKRLSLQRHRRRSEHWYILSGTVIVTRDGENLRMAPGQSADIPVGAAHRAENPGGENAELIEIQTGEYFGEDDIERIEDDYGRI